MKLDYFTIENLEINKNSFFYNIMQDLNEEEKQEQRYFEIFDVEQFTTYLPQKNFFIRIQKYVDSFVNVQKVKTLRKLFKFIEIIQKYCLNIDKVKDIVQNLRPIPFTDNYLQTLLIKEICLQNFRGKISFRFLREFVSPLNIALFWQQILDIAIKEDDYKCFDSFQKQFGGFSIDEMQYPQHFFYNNYKINYLTVYQYNNKYDKQYVRNFLFPSCEQPLCFIQIGNCVNSPNDFNQDILFFGARQDRDFILQTIDQFDISRKMKIDGKKVFDLTNNSLQQKMQVAENYYLVYLERQKEKIQQMNNVNQRQEQLSRDQILQKQFSEINQIINIQTQNQFVQIADMFQTLGKMTIIKM